MKTLIVSILACLVLLGCSSDGSRNAGDSAAGSSVTTDPVSGAAVPTDSPWTATWHGNRYCFESEENLWKFQSDPTAYVREDGRPNPERPKVYPHEVR
jgi:YHS domain-containing protein